MAIYRHDWTMPQTGWLWRLDIVPYDGALSDAAESMTTDNVPRVIGDLQIERSFDELPVGLCNAATCTLTLVWSALKTDLKTRLRNKRSGDARNTFLIYSNRGSGTATTLEFVGVQATIAGGTLQRDDSGEITYEVDLVDAVYATLAATSGVQMCDAYTDESTTNYPTAWETNFGALHRSDSFQSARYEETRFSAGYRLATPNYIFGHIRKKLSERLKVIAGRTIASGVAVDEQAADYLLTLPTAFDNIARFYRQQPSTYPRASNATPLTAANIRLIASVVDRDNNRIGGLMSEADKMGFARYESAWDFVKDYAETLCAKIYYITTVQTLSGNPYLRVQWFVLPTLEPFAGTANINSGRAVEVGELEDEAPTIGKVEVRAMYSHEQPTTDYVINSGVTRAERSFNVQCTMFSNLPTVKEFTKAGDFKTTGIGGVRFVDMYSKGLFETNMLMELLGDANNPTKVHERTRLYYTNSDYVELDDVISADPPALTTNAQREAHNLWVGEVQALTGLPRAISEFYSTVFGRDDLAYIDLTFALPTTNVDPDMLGAKCNITGTLATTMAGYGWSSGHVVATTFDGVAGTVKLRLLLWK